MIKKITFRVAALVIVFTALELLARIFFGEPLTKLDSVLGWRTGENLDRSLRGEDGDFTIRTNRAGYRDRDRSLAPTPGNCRIAVIGDSYVFGAGGVDNDELFTNLLERQVSTSEVLNFGVMGYSTDQEYLLLITEVLKYQPNVVLLVVFWNDNNESFLSYHPKIAYPKPRLRPSDNGFIIDAPKISVWEQWSQYSRLATWIERRIAMSRAKKRSIPTSSISDQQWRATYVALLQSMNDACRAANAELLVIYIPHPLGQPAPVEMQEVMQSLASRGVIQYAELSGFFEAGR